MCLFCGHHLQWIGVNIICVLDAPRRQHRSTGGMMKSKFTLLAWCKTCWPFICGAPKGERARECGKSCGAGDFSPSSGPFAVDGCRAAATGRKNKCSGCQVSRFVCRRKNATRFHWCLLSLLLRHKESEKNHVTSLTLRVGFFLFSLMCLGSNRARLSDA